MALSRLLLLLTAGATALSAPRLRAMDYPVDSQAAFDALNSTDFEPGDRILLESGMTFSGSLNFTAEDGGTALDPIIITSSGTERATIAPGDDDGIDVYNAGGYVIRNLNFVGSGVAEDGTTSSTRPGINFYADSPGDIKYPLVHLDQLEVSGFGNRGVIIGGFSGSTGYHDVRITNVVAHGNLRSGIETYGFTDVNDALTNVYVGHCRCFHNVGNFEREAHGIVLGGVDGGVIERCLAYDNGQNNRSLGIWAYTSTNLTIQFNESHSNKSAVGDGGVGFDFDKGVTNSTMQYNYSHDNFGAGYLQIGAFGLQASSGNVLRYNISESDGRNPTTPPAGAIEIGSAVSNLDVYGNTVFLDGQGTSITTPAVFIYGGILDPTGVLLANNLLVTTGGLGFVRYTSFLPSTITFAGNNYWPSGGAFVIDYKGTSYSSLTAWRSRTGQEMLGGTATGSSADPLLTAPGNGGTIGDPGLLTSLSAYTLQADSPLIGAGLDLQAEFGVDPGPRDYYGVSLPQGSALEVGASEFVSPTPAPPLLLDVSYDQGSNTVTLDYQSEDGVSFGVRRSPDLTGDPANEWTSLPATAPGDDSVMQYADTPPAGSQFFYVLVRE